MTVGRLGLAHPALATAGGSALWTIINSIYQVIGDSVAGRYFSASAVASGSTVTFTHNFGAPFAEYRLALYTASGGVIGSRINIGTSWTVVADATNPTTVVDVSNVSAATTDIVLVMVHDGGSTNYSFLPFVQQSTPATPASGTTLLYPKSDGNFYSLNSNGIEAVIGSGSGSGSKNYLAASASTASGWTGYGNVTVSTDTTASDLPRANTTKTGVKFQPSGATSGTFTSTGSGQTLTSTAAHGMLTGYVASFSTSGTLPAPLVTGTGYYVNVLSSTTFQVASSMAALIAGSYQTFTSSGSGTQSFTFGGAYARFTEDVADYSVVQQVAFAQNILNGVAGDWEVDIYSNTAAAGSGTYTRLSLTSDSSGSTVLPNAVLTNTGSTFSAPNATAPYVEFRFNKILPNTHPLVVSDLSIGPGQIVQGPAISGWQSYTPSFTGFGTPANSTFAYRQIGDSIEIQGIFQSGTPTASTASVSLPTGYTAFIANGAASYSTVGFFNTNQGSASGGIALPSSSNSIIYFTTAGSSNTPLTGNTVTTSTANAVVTLFARFQVVQLVGAASSYNGQNTPQYYFTTSAWGTTNTSATTSQGAGGVLGGTTTPSSANFYYEFFPATPIPVGSKPVFEHSVDGVHWSPAGSYNFNIGLIESLRYDGTNFIGAAASLTSSGQIAVLFGKYPAGTTTNSWNGSWYWRVTVGYPGQAVGFGPYVPNFASGLVPAYGLPGRTDGTTAATGTAGEIITNTGTLLLSTSQQNVTSVPLTGGRWRVRGSVQLASAPNTRTYVDASITTTSAGTGTVGSSRILAAAAGSGTASYGCSQVVDQYFSVTAPNTQTVYLTASVAIASTGAGDVGTLIAERLP